MVCYWDRFGNPPNRFVWTIKITVFIINIIQMYVNKAGTRCLFSIIIENDHIVIVEMMAVYFIFEHSSAVCFHWSFKQHFRRRTYFNNGFIQKVRSSRRKGGSLKSELKRTGGGGSYLSVRSPDFQTAGRVLSDKLLGSF